MWTSSSLHHLGSFKKRCVQKPVVALRAQQAFAAEGFPGSCVAQAFPPSNAQQTAPSGAVKAAAAKPPAKASCPYVCPHSLLELPLCFAGQRCYITGTWTVAPAFSFFLHIHSLLQICCACSVLFGTCTGGAASRMLSWFRFRVATLIWHDLLHVSWVFDLLCLDR